MLWRMAFPWSDNWWIEEDKAYFCASEINALFCVNMNSQECGLVDWIPVDSVSSFRSYSYCIKYQSLIFCLPNKGKNAWVYDVENKTWENVIINNENYLLGNFFPYTSYSNHIWMREEISGKVFEIDLDNRVLNKQYNMPQFEGKLTGKFTLVQDKLYILSGNKIYSINRDVMNVYELSEIRTELYTICYDGINFWLSGFCKEIYVWNPERRNMKVITDFPEQFGLYRFGEESLSLVDHNSFYSRELPFFTDSVSLGKYVWFIPFQSNEIIYVDKDSYNMNILRIDEERETQESIKRPFRIKYLVQYIRENRYIGLYSVKNQVIFEIDSIQCCVKYMNYRLSKKAVLSIIRKSYNNRILMEGINSDMEIYSILISDNRPQKTPFIQNRGKYIYDFIEKR